MKKVLGIQAELNITADEDVIRGIGKGISNGSIVISDIIKEVKPEIVKSIKKLFIEKEDKKTSENN
jgi:hypothetical protein